MSSKPANEQKADQEVGIGVREVSTANMRTTQHVQRAGEHNQVGPGMTSGMENFQGEFTKSEHWSSSADPQTSFRQIDEELPAVELAREDAEGAAGDASCLSQVGAVFEAQTGERDRGRSMSSQQPGQPELDGTRGNNEPKYQSSQPPDRHNGST